MAVYSWATILLSRISNKPSVTEELLQDYWARDEALITQPASTEYDEASTSSATYDVGGTVTRKTFVSELVGENPNGSFALVLHFQAKVTTTGDDLKVRARVGGGAWAESPVLDPETDAGLGNYADYELAITDVDTDLGITTELEVQIKRNSGSGTVYHKCHSAASRLEHRTT